MMRLLDIITEPDNTITNMRTCTFATGDFVFYRDKDGATQPHTVSDTKHRGHGRGGWHIKLDDGRWVRASNCQLQEDWRKENELGDMPKNWNAQ